MPAGEGRNIIDLRDAKGKYIVRAIIKTADRSGEGWVDYQWLNPATKKAGPQESFVRKVPGTDMIVHVGIYR